MLLLTLNLESTHSSYCLLLLMTTLTRFGRGLNFFGMLSHVFLPMRTALTLPSGAFEVTRAKYCISFDSRHGRRPLCPMPLLRVTATMIVNLVMVVGIKERTGSSKIRGRLLG